MQRSVQIKAYFQAFLMYSIHKKTSNAKQFHYNLNDGKIMTNKLLR